MTLDKALDDAIDLFCSVDEEPDSFELTLSQWGQIATLLKAIKAAFANAKRIQYEKPKTLDMLERENKELRELVKKAYALSETLCGMVENSPGCFMCPTNQDEDKACGSALIYNCMHELGIEVE